MTKACWNQKLLQRAFLLCYVQERQTELCPFSSAAGYLYEAQINKIFVKELPSDR
jgi:hypothetical protein